MRPDRIRYGLGRVGVSLVAAVALWAGLAAAAAHDDSSAVGVPLLLLAIVATCVLGNGLWRCATRVAGLRGGSWRKVGAAAGRYPVWPRTGTVVGYEGDDGWRLLVVAQWFSSAARRDVEAERWLWRSDRDWYVTPAGHVFPGHRLFFPRAGGGGTVGAPGLIDVTGQLELPGADGDRARRARSALDGALGPADA